MKIITKFLFFFYFFFTCFICYSQNAPVDNVTRDDVDAILIKCRDISNPNDPLFYLDNQNQNAYRIRVNFNQIVTGINNTSVDFNTCQQAIDMLNLQFFDHNISFEWNCEINTIDDNEYDNPAAIDINIFEAIGTFKVQAFTIPSTKLVLLKDQLLTPVLTHEIGHCLGLLHTYSGSFSEDQFNCEEFVDQSSNPDNCIKCGDCICETSASYFVSKPELDENCLYLGDEQDSQQNTYNNIPLNNVMSGFSTPNSNICGDDIDNEQGLRMRNIIEHSGYLDRIRIYESFAEIKNKLGVEPIGGFNVGNEIFIDEDIKVSNEIVVFGDYHINLENDVTLDAIDCHIYNGCEEWGGIKIHGTTTQDNDRLIMNVCTIENAKTGISQKYNGFGGKMELNNVDFINCNRGIELMKYEQDESIINDCHFYNGQFGITSWANDIKITNCTFDGQSKYGFYGIDASPNIIGNYNGTNTTFSNIGEAGILLAFPSGQDNQTTIENNSFDNTNYGVRLISGAGSSDVNNTLIQQNFFTGNSVGFYGDGANMYALQNNDFIENGFGNYVGNSGGDFCNILENYYFDEGLGAAYTGQNDNTFVRQNCYDNHDFTDVYVNGLFVAQGTPAISNSNCFSTTNDEIRTGANSQNFLYYEPKIQDNPPPCMIVESSGNFVLDKSNAFENVDDCGASNFSSPSPPSVDHPCKPNRNETDVKLAINDLYMLITQTENNTLLDSTAQQSLLAYYRNCLRNVKMTLVDILIVDNSSDEAIDTLRADFDFTMQIKGYGILVNQDRFIEAEIYLNNLQPSNNPENGFIATQRIYLNSLLDDTFIPSQSELDFIENIGEEHNLLASFSRSIYLYFTESTINLDISIENIDPGLPRSIEVKEKEIKLFPNPVFHSGKFEIEYNFEINETIEYQYYSIDGKILKVGILDQNNRSISTKLIENGIGFIKFRFIDGSITTKKIAVW